MHDNFGYLFVLIVIGALVQSALRRGKPRNRHDDFLAKVMKQHREQIEEDTSRSLWDKTHPSYVFHDEDK